MMVLVTMAGVAFELRDGETASVCDEADATYAAGMFPLVPPGDLATSDHPQGGACEPVMLAFARKKGDKWAWSKLGPASHHAIGEWLATKTRGRWHYFTLAHETTVAMVRE